MEDTTLEVIRQLQKLEVSEGEGENQNHPTIGDLPHVQQKEDKPAETASPQLPLIEELLLKATWKTSKEEWEEGKVVEKLRELPEERVFKLSPSLVSTYYYQSCDRFLSFKSNYLDRIRWCCKDKVGNWNPFTLKDSVAIEVAFMNGKESLLVENEVIDLIKYKENCSVGSLEGHLRRGVWFYNQNNDWVPFPEDITKILEHCYKTNNNTLLIQGVLENRHITINMNTHSFSFESGESFELIRGYPVREDLLTVSNTKLGDIWEEEVIKLIEKEGIPLMKKEPQENIKFSENRFTAQEFIDILRNLKPDIASRNQKKFLYQPTVTVVEAFYTHYGIPKSKVLFQNCYPDLLEISCTNSLTDEWTITVVEIKASNSMKLYHRVQVALYTILLRFMLEAHGIHNIKLSDHGAVWLKPKQYYKSFRLGGISSIVSSFLSFEGDGILKRLVSTEIGKENWNFAKKCKTCQFYEICSNQATQENSISLLPMTISNRNALNKYLQQSGQCSIQDAHKVLSTLPQPPNYLLNNVVNNEHSNAVLWNIRTQLESYVEKVPKSYKKASKVFTSNSDIQVVIGVLDHGPSNLYYAYYIALKVVGKYSEKTSQIFKEVATFPNCKVQQKDFLSFIGFSNQGGLEGSFVETLFSILNLIHIHNQNANDWKKEVSLQCYTFSWNEYHNIFALLKHLSLNTLNTTKQAQAQTLLFTLFDEPKFLVYNSHPDLNTGNVLSQLVCLRYVIEDLVALPITFDSDFDDFYKIFHVLNFQIEEEYSMNEISILNWWTKYTLDHNDTWKNRILNRLADRINAYFIIISEFTKLLEANSPLTLCRKSPTFLFRSLLGYSSATLSRLSFLATAEEYYESKKLYSSRSSVLQAVQGLAGNFEKIIIAKCIHDPLLQEMGPGGDLSEDSVFFEILFSSQNFTNEEETSDVPPWAICKLDATGIKDFLCYNDTKQSIFGKYQSLLFGSIKKISQIEQRKILLAKIKNFNSKQGELFVFTPRHIDLLSKWLNFDIIEVDYSFRFHIAFKELPIQNAPHFLKWFRDVSLQYAESPVSKKNSELSFSVPPQFIADFESISSKLPFKKVKTGQWTPLSEDPQEKKIVYKALYQSIQEFQHSAPNTTSLINQLFSDPLPWGRTPLEGPEAPNGLFTSTALQLSHTLKDHLLTEVGCKLIESVLNQRLRLIWGPPGSGKTHFLSVMASVLLEAHRRALPPSPFRILFVGFTHKSIDHFLQKLLEISALVQQATASPPFPIARLASSPKATHPAVASIPTATPSAASKFYHAHPHCIIAGTVWAVRKVFQKEVSKLPYFDMLVIDEASQLPIAQTLLPFKILHPNNGRLVLAGDHYQLPPIMVAKYPKRDAKKVLPFWSFFHFVVKCDVQKSCFSMLEENWRMNKCLCEFSAKKLYKQVVGEKTIQYHPANASVGGQSFSLGLLEGEDYHFRDVLLPHRVPVRNCLLRRIVDRENPFIVVKLGKERFSVGPDPAAGKDSFLGGHSQFIAGITKAFWKLNMIKNKEDFEVFARKRLLVVAPHNNQRYDIAQALEPAHFSISDRTPIYGLINTVERAQGQEVDVVVIDYGIFDAQNLDFIFSRNRLNVAITRARQKVVLVITSMFFQCFGEVFENKELERGFMFLQDVMNYSKDLGTFFEVSVSDISQFNTDIQKEPIFTANSIQQFLI